ncbi:TNF receptor-associated factor 6 isoform 2-T5 [Morus bassanus]
MMTWTVSSHPKIQMKSGTRDPCGGCWYGALDRHMPTHWQYWPGKTERNRRWMNWLTNSGYMKKLSSSLRACVLALEKLSLELQQLEEDMPYCPPVQTSISAIRSKHPSAQERGYSGYTPQATLWFYLRDHGEDMRKWDGKSTSTLEAQMPNHYDNDCPTAPVPCFYSAFGCPEKMQRNELARHMQEFTQVHMRMMAQSFQNISVTATNPVPFINGLPFEPALFSQVSHATYDCNPEVENFKETIQQLEGRLVRQDHQIRELIAKMETQNTHMAELKRTIRNLEGKITEMEAQQCNGIYIWKIENFSGLQKAQEEERPVVMHSPGFYTGRPGYKLCLRLHIQLPNAQRCANFISLFVHTMQGEYDSHLPWPFQGTIRLSILDQSEGPERQNHEEVMEAKPELLAFQRPTIHRNPKGFGYVTFMHLQTLKQRTFVKDDTLLVRCEVLTRLDLNSLRREGFQARSADGAM